VAIRRGAPGRRAARVDFDGRPPRAARLEFAGRPPRAVLFDFDGVLVDSERDHWRAFRAVLGPLGVPLSWERYERRYLVFDDRSAIRAMLRDAGRDGAAGVGDLVRRKRALFRRLCGGAPRVLPPAAALVRALARRLPLAIVSGAAGAEVRAALGRAGLERQFRCVVAAEDVRRCKPDPEGYRRALRRLGMAAGDGCVAIEDSPGGIRAARAAGLAVLGVATSYPAAALRRAGAARVYRSIAAVGPAVFAS
jgi:beta-phosphoglucomutase